MDKSVEQTSELAKIDGELTAVHARRVTLAEKRAQLNARLYDLGRTASIDADFERANIQATLRSPSEDLAIAADQKTLLARRDGVLRLAQGARNREATARQTLARVEHQLRELLSNVENARNRVEQTQADIDAAIAQRLSLVGK